MAQWLKSLALAEDADLVPSIHMGGLTPASSTPPVPGNLAPFSGLLEH